MVRFGCFASKSAPLNLRSTVTINRSPALNASSSQSASPSRLESWPKPYTDAILEDGQAHLIPALVALQEPGGFALDDRRLHRVERGKHPCDRARGHWHPPAAAPHGAARYGR